MRSFVSAICVLCTLSSCSLFEAITSRPTPEDAVAAEESYLQGGPNTDVELGSDERTLLEEYKAVHDQNVKLETQLSEVQAENAQLRTQLTRTEEERDRYRNHLAGSNQENERAVERVRALEAKVLSLNIEKTQVEQELLRLRISALREEYETLTASPTSPPPGGGR